MKLFNLAVKAVRPRGRVNDAGVGARQTAGDARVGPPAAAVRVPNPNPTGIAPVMPAEPAVPAAAAGVQPPSAQPATVQPQSPLQTQTAPPLVGEYGTQDSLFGPGFAFSAYGERFTSDLLARNKGWQVYELMLRDDQIAACLQLAHAFITSRGWHFHVDDTARQGPAAALLQYNFSRALRGTVRQLLDFMLTARPWGFALIEKIFDVLPWEGRSWWMLTGYKLRPAWTFTFQTDRNGNVLSIVQQQYSQRLQVPPDKFIHAVYQPEFDAQYGRSALIPVYDRWFEKKNTNKFWDIQLERCAAGFVLGTMPQGMDAKSIATLQAALDNLQAQSSILMPAGGTIEYVTPHDTKAFEARMEDLNQAIARGLLLPSHVGLSDQGSTGSRAQGTSQLETFMNVVDAWSAWAEDIVNEQLILPLHTWNFGTDVPPPLFRFERLTAAQKHRAVKAITDAIGSGVVRRTDEDEALVRERLGMSPRDYGAADTPITPRAARGRLPDPSSPGTSPPGPGSANGEGEKVDAGADVSVDGGGEEPDENDPGAEGARNTASNPLYGTERRRLGGHLTPGA